jgi:toxin ParE1/3/4
VRRKLVVRPKAVADLEGQALFVAAGDIEAGLRLYAAADRAYDRLLEMPELGVTRDFGIGRLEGLRMWPIPGFPNHLIFYRPTDAGVEVVRVLHAARDIPGVLDE